MFQVNEKVLKKGRKMTLEERDQIINTLVKSGHYIAACDYNHFNKMNDQKLKETYDHYGLDLLCW